MSYDHFLDMEHEKHYQDDEPCTGCADEDCECQDMDEEDFDIPDLPDYDDAEADYEMEGY